MTVTEPRDPVYLNALGVVNALGRGGDAVLANLLRGVAPGMQAQGDWIPERTVHVGAVTDALPVWPEHLGAFHSRNNRLLAAAAEEIAEPLAAARERFGADRIGVVLGSSTSGIAEGEAAIAAHMKTGTVPPEFDYRQQEIASPSEGLARLLGLDGLAYTISTACSSSAKAFAAARNLIELDQCDAVVVGGADSLCRLTINGFAALESVAAGPCRPFSSERDGINIGEGAALFLMTREPGPIRLAGVGESCDAHHISAPEPEGLGAEAAMRAALQEAGVEPDEIAYLNLHGTATPKNDEMESAAAARVLGPSTPCSSTKSLTGHTLGPAGAIEVALCWLLLSEGNTDNVLPAHIFNGPRDESLARIGLLEEPGRLPTAGPRYLLSNSFAFGGNNCSVLIAG
jgi:3-oxoacyl-[acyl-carrier-protein] synthase-1